MKRPRRHHAHDVELPRDALPSFVATPGAKARTSQLHGFERHCDLWSVHATHVMLMDVAGSMPRFACVRKADDPNWDRVVRLVSLPVSTP